MRRARADGVEIAYDTMGSPADPTVVLIMGLGGQLIEWDPAFCQVIVDAGYQVVRLDNRDAGLSTHLDVEVDAMAAIAAVGAGERPELPYRLPDMAADVVAVLDDLGVERAHVVGASMGGMIAQTVAIEHRARVRTLVSIMSTTGEPHVGAPTAAALAALFGPPARNRAEAQDHKVHHARTWGSKDVVDEERLRRIAGALWDRGVDPQGTARQLAAIMASGSRADGLRALDVPTLVIHGTIDELVQPSGGERTAELVPDAKLLMIERMGHDLPVPFWPQVTGAILAHLAEHPG
jgi:pimeloyl-ACP methyl ester carboxylesterase